MKPEDFLPRHVRFSHPRAPYAAPRAEDAHYMELCLQLAKEAMAAGDVPVGAVMVRNGEIIAQAGNRREQDRNALHHAEILCIDEACRKLGTRRLNGCTLYVTLEPCPMCGGALINAQISRLVFGARDSRAGVFGEILNLNRYPLGHTAEVTRDVLGAECLALLQAFFADRRRS